MRGARFPVDYYEFLILEGESLAGVFGQYDSKLGDVIVMGDGDEREVFAAGPCGWEALKFGREWRSPD
jgi:hypothetical protein